MKKSSKKNSFNVSDYIYLLAGIVFLTGIVLLVWFSSNFIFKDTKLMSNFLENGKKEPAVSVVCDVKYKLTGECASASASEPIDPDVYVAVMIENHVDARPQSGLSSASVVYEAPVEANITRFLAIYDSSTNVAKVGPVRSARPYYLDWASEYDNPMYMHVGGSPDALEKLELYSMFDLNEFYRGWYFWRSDDRLAPHNVYTSTELWQKALRDYAKDRVGGNFVPWKFTDKLSLENTKPANLVTISFAPPAYEAVWKFTTSTNKYERWQSGRLHLDMDGKKIEASTVIVQRVQVKVLDNVGRRAIATIGSGEAEVFINGKVINGIWKKESRTARTLWYTKDGQEILLAPGHIWVEVLGQDGSVIFE